MNRSVSWFAPSYTFGQRHQEDTNTFCFGTGYQIYMKIVPSSKTNPLGSRKDAHLLRRRGKYESSSDHLGIYKCRGVRARMMHHDDWITLSKDSYHVHQWTEAGFHGTPAFRLVYCAVAPFQIVNALVTDEDCGKGARRHVGCAAHGISYFLSASGKRLPAAPGLEWLIHTHTSNVVENMVVTAG